jgi:hypothetical protein
LSGVIEGLSSQQPSKLVGPIKLLFMLPKEIRDILDKYSDDEYSFSVTRADNSEGFELDFVIYCPGIDNEEGLSQLWTVKGVGFRKGQFFFGPADFIEIAAVSPLLWEFLDFQSELYFTGTIKDPARLFVDLYKTHNKLYGRYQTSELPFSEVALSTYNLAFTSGQIAKGPRKLLEHYAQCLTQNGLKFTIVGDRPPTVWNGFKHVKECENLYALFLGDCYVIAEKFIFTKLDRTI